MSDSKRETQRRLSEKRRERANKAREREVLEHLLRRAGIGATVVQETETPDFLLDLDGRRIGAEVTEYVRGRSAIGSAVRQQHAFIEGILQRAQAAFASRSATSVWVTVDAAAGRVMVGEVALAKELVEKVEICLQGDTVSPGPLPFGLTLPPRGPAS